MSYVTPDGEHVGYDASDPASMEAWFGPFGYAEHIRKIVLASARELERAKATARQEKVSETRLDDLARVSDRYVQYIVDTLKGRQLRETNVLSTMAGR